jgi:hypothetical protein
MNYDKIKIGKEYWTHRIRFSKSRLTWDEFETPYKFKVTGKLNYIWFQFTLPNNTISKKYYVDSEDICETEKECYKNMIKKEKEKIKQYEEFIENRKERIKYIKEEM